MKRHLDINNSGAWKRICSFDAGNATVSEQILASADQLASCAAIAASKDAAFKMRITDEGGKVLTRWNDSRKGWDKA